MQRVFPIWLSCIAQHADRLICVSASVAEDVKAWIAENSHWVKPNPLLTVSNFHLEPTSMPAYRPLACRIMPGAVPYDGRSHHLSWWARWNHAKDMRRR